MAKSMVKNMAGKMDCNVTIKPSVRGKLGRLSKKAIVELAHKVLKSTKCENSVELSILVTNDREIRCLNKKYRHKDKATDVLSFAPAEAKEFVCLEHVLGDIVISAETAKKQAKEFKISFAEEFSRLLVHGILHLLGYDHEGVSERKAVEMRNLEDKLLKRLH